MHKPAKWSSALLLLSIVALTVALASYALMRQEVRSAAWALPPPRAEFANGPIEHEAYRWRPVAIGGGGFITGLSFDRSGKTRIAKTDVYGAYIWRAEIDQWAQLVTASAMPPEYRYPASMHSGPFAVAVAPSDGSHIYLAAGGWVLSSDDGGASWARPGAPAPFPLPFGNGSLLWQYDSALAVSPEDPDLVLFGSPFNGLWRSSDGGHSWARAKGIADLDRQATGTSAGIQIWFQAGRPDRASILAMAPGQGMFVSEDTGVTFKPLRSATADDPQNLSAGAFAADGTFFGADPEGRGLWRYREGLWRNIAKDGPLQPRKYVTVAINPRSTEIFAFEHNGRAWRSADEGESWRQLTVQASVGQNDPPWLRIANHPFFATAQVRFDPVVPDRMWVAAGTGVFYADAPARVQQIRWVSESRGIEELVTNDVIQPPGRAPLFAAWDFGIHVKSDLDAFSTGYGPRERVLIAAQQLAWSPSNPAIIVTNASDTRNCCAEDGLAVLAGYSEDGGATWARFATLPQPPGTSKDDPWRMSFGMIAVSANDPNNIVWAPSFDRSPFYTRDRGRSWRRVVFPGEILPFTGSHPAKHLQRKVLVADQVAPGTFYLAHSGNASNPGLSGLWRTSDGGETWTQLTKGEIAPASGQAAKLRAVPNHSGHLYFTSGVAGGPDTRLRRSLDGGKNWTALDRIDRVDDITFGKAAVGANYPAIYLSGFIDQKHGFWRSIDGGGSWARIGELPIGRLDRVTVLGADPDVFGRLYVGYQGSGWIYGQPASCTPIPLASFALDECISVQ